MAGVGVWCWSGPLEYPTVDSCAFLIMLVMYLGFGDVADIPWVNATCIFLLVVCFLLVLGFLLRPHSYGGGCDGPLAVFLCMSFVTLQVPGGRSVYTCSWKHLGPVIVLYKNPAFLIETRSLLPRIAILFVRQPTYFFHTTRFAHASIHAHPHH